MTKNTKLVWRLGKLPSPDEIRELVKDKIITNEEAREILFSSETEETRDLKSLEAEVKYLKELIVKLAETRNIVETIRYVEKPVYKQWDWYTPTVNYLCSNGQTTGTGITLIG